MDKYQKQLIEYNDKWLSDMIDRSYKNWTDVIEQDYDLETQKVMAGQIASTAKATEQNDTKYFEPWLEKFKDHQLVVDAIKKECGL